MKKLSTVLTMTLLLGSALNATGLHTDAPLTPRSAAHAWLEKAAGQEPTVSPNKIHEDLRSAVNTAKTAGNPERVLELWRVQQTFAKDSGVKPTDVSSHQTIYPAEVHEALKTATYPAKTAGNPERVLELWRAQQTFAKDSGVKPINDSGVKQIGVSPLQIIYPSDVHQALYKAADTAKTAGNPERVLELWRTQKAFTQESGEKPYDICSLQIISPSNVHQAFSATLHTETNSTRIIVLFETWAEFAKIEELSASASYQRPDTFKAKYEAAKKEVEKTRTLPAGRRVEAASSKLSVGFLISEHGRSNIDASSLTALQTSFNAYYKTAVLRLHPDKNPTKTEDFKILQAHKDWVDSLTEATFVASAK